MYRKRTGWLWLLVLVVNLAGCGVGETTFGPAPVTPTEHAREEDVGAAATDSGPEMRDAGETVGGTGIAPTDEAALAPSPSPTRDSPSPISEPTIRPSDTPGPRSTPTNTPAPDGTPSPTPTLGPKVTRTPAPPEVCPEPVEDLPTIEPIEPGTAIVEGFEPQIRAFLDAGGSAESLRVALSELSLTDGEGTIWQARAQTIPVDVTGNTTADVIVSLSFAVEGQYAEVALFVYSCSGGDYQGGAVVPLGGQLLSIGGPDPGIRAIQDMNADGVPEIVISTIEMIGTHGNFTRQFRILEWDRSQFVDLVRNDSGHLNAAPVENGDGAVFDTNGNKNQELVLTNGPGQGYLDGGAQRERIDTWAWNGYEFRLFRSEYESPIYRFQAVQDGDDRSLAGRYQDALEFYEQAISDDELLGWSEGQLWPDTVYGQSARPTPDPDERARLSAYALYRSMLTQVIFDAPEEAGAAFTLLQERFPEGTPGYPYAQLAEAFWSEYRTRADVGRACAKAAQFADSSAEAILTPLGSQFYGYLNRDYEAQDVCPFGE